MMICLFAIASSVGALIASRMLVASMTRAEVGVDGDLTDARAIQLVGVRSLADANACLLSGGRRFVAEARASSQRELQLVESMRSRLADPAGRTALEDVRAAERASDEAFETALAAMRAPGGGNEPADLAAELSQADRFDAALTALVGHFEAVRLARAVTSGASASRAEMLLNLITTVTIALLALTCLLLIVALQRSYLVQQAARSDAEQGETAARASLTEAETASHLKDEFLATVSHELRNPLAPILTWTQLLRSGTLDEEKTKRALEIIERNVLSQSQLINDLVDVSRVASGKFRLDVRPLDLAPVIRSAADAQGPANEAKQIRLQLVLDERSGVISGDSERILQVMSNLIANAIKFTPKGGRVQVVLQRVESHVEIIVSDSGIGIDPAFLPHVFEPFRQASGGSMRRHGGLGLGLSIVRHIVELHGGEISAHSDGPGLGSRFIVKFPVLATTLESHVPATRPHPAARDTLTDLRPGRLDGVRVMVVDDEPNASEALVALFESCGADPRAAGSAPEALAMFDVWRPDVLVSDIAMPGEDGYSLIRKIRTRAPLAGGTIPAVALTAYAKIEDRVTILAAGFQMYLSKPADPTELVAVVSSLATGHRLTLPRAAS